MRLLFIAAVLLIPGIAHADASDEKLVQEVGRKLIAQATPPEGMSWPPHIEIHDGQKFNAYASTRRTPAAPTKPEPYIVIYAGIMERVVQGDPDRLAYILGHELAHLVLRHPLLEHMPSETELLKSATTRQQELDADRLGVEIALKAGYSFTRGRRAIQIMLEMGLEYSSFEGLGSDHPSWKDRLTALDTEQSGLWKSMAAFDNGVVFLSVEQYVAAERCFESVRREFPGCYEAWANLGYAQLMRYCDALEPDDIRHMGLAHLVCGAFYRRPASLEAQVRGIDEKLWFDAKASLIEALRLKPDLTVAKANLGIAYLVSPNGKELGEATRYLGEAAASALADPSLDPVAKAAILINASVVDISSNQLDACRSKLAEAEHQYALRSKGAEYHIPSTLSVSAAMLYNRALLSRHYNDNTGASALLEKYLREATPASVWWQQAYTLYEETCKSNGTPTKQRTAFTSLRRTALRPVVGVQLPGGKSVTLSEEIQAVAKTLGIAEPVPVSRGAGLSRRAYAGVGLEILAADQVVAIMLSGANAPDLILRVFGTGTGIPPSVLKIGMSKDALEKILGDEYDYRQLDDPDPAHSYRFYRDVGLAVRIQDGNVKEIVIVQIPDRPVPGA